MTPDPVQAACDRSAAAMAVLEKHADELTPHILMLLGAFDERITRSIVAGRLEAAIIAFRNAGHVVVPFRGEGG